MMFWPMHFLPFLTVKNLFYFRILRIPFMMCGQNFFGIGYKRVPLREDFHLHSEDYKVENGGIIFPNPNAPTGILEELSVVEEILMANPGVVVIVDEAYVDFGGVSALKLLNKYDNLLVVQTFSKSRAMAGMRIGFAIGSEKMISYLNDVKFSFNSYTMNQTAIAMGVACVEDDAYFKEIVAKVVTTRERVKKELRNLGFTFLDSKSNFIFATHQSVSAKEIFEACKKQQIYVRYFAKPRIDNYLRISIGTEEDMNSLIAFLGDFLKDR